MMVVTTPARERKGRGPAARTTKAGGGATGTPRICLGQRAKSLGGEDRGRSEEVMAHACVEDVGEAGS